MVEETIKIEEEELDNFLKELEGESETEATKESSFITKDELKKELSDALSNILKGNGGTQTNNTEEETGNVIELKKRIELIENRTKQQYESTQEMLLKEKREQRIKDICKKSEETFKSKYPYLKIDELHLSYDLRMGMSEKEAISKQIAEEEARMNRYGYKKQESASGGIDINAGSVEDFSAFNNESHKSKEFHNLSKIEKENYWAKLERFQKSKK